MLRTVVFSLLMVVCSTYQAKAQSGLHPQWASENEITYYDRSGNVWSYHLQNAERKILLKGSQPAPNPIKRGLIAVRSKSNGKSTIVIKNIKTKEEIVIDDPLLGEGNAFHPIWSKDGKVLAFHAENGKEKTSDLFIYNYEKKELQSYLKDQYVGAPSFFANGAVLLSLIREDGSTLVRYDYRSDQITELMPSASRNFFADPSPSGEELMYCSEEGGNMDLWLFNINSGEKTQLTNTPEKEYTPRWSPSGEHILYFVERNNTYQVWLMGRDGSDRRNLNE